MHQPAPAETFERLYQTAVSLVRELGYDNVSVSNITHEIGIAKGTFFNYFPTKDHVLSEALHRSVESAFSAARLQGFTGTEAILAFSRTLARHLSEERVLTEALVSRLSGLPTPAGRGQDVVREEERVRSWLEARLEEALPVSVPLVPADLGVVAFLLTWSIHGTLDEWVRSEAAPEALQGMITDRVEFLLASVGLPADPIRGSSS
jgi:AcrR family transcriptional regulator